MEKEYINVLENELNKKTLRENTKRCYLTSFKRFFYNNKKNKSNDILNTLKAIKNKTELSQVINSIRLIQNNNKNISIIPESSLKEIIKNKPNNRHKSYEPYELSDKLRRINKIRDEKLRLAYRLMIVSGLRVFEVEALVKEDIEINNNDIVITVRDGKGGKFGEVKCLEDKYLSKKLKDFLEDKVDDEKVFYAVRTMQNKAQELGFKCHDLRRAYAKLVKKELMKELVEIPEEEKEKIIEEEIKVALRHSKFETSKKYLYSKRIKV